LSTSSATEKQLFITKSDLDQLRTIVRAIWPNYNRRTKSIVDLAEKLDRASVVSPADIPPEIATMNSRFLICDLSSNKEFVYTLVFPNEANIEQGMISILSPIGAAVIGRSAGDIFECTTPLGIARMKLIAIFYQPESSGDN